MVRQVAFQFAEPHSERTRSRPRWVTMRAGPSCACGFEGTGSDHMCVPSMPSLCLLYGHGTS